MSQPTSNLWLKTQRKSIRTGQSTSENWRALKKIALALFKAAYLEDPDKTAEQILGRYELPQNRLLMELIQKAGFRRQIEPATEEFGIAAAYEKQGIPYETAISRQTSAPVVRVHSIPAAIDLGYGMVPYGHAHYGGCRKVSDGKRAVARKVTTNGQLSYRGHLYSIGVRNRGQVAKVLERDAQIIVSLPGKTRLQLAARHDFTSEHSKS